MMLGECLHAGIIEPASMIFIHESSRHPRIVNRRLTLIRYIRHRAFKEDSWSDRLES